MQSHSLVLYVLGGDANSVNAVNYVRAYGRALGPVDIVDVRSLTASERGAMPWLVSVPILLNDTVGAVYKGTEVWQYVDTYGGDTWPSGPSAATTAPPPIDDGLDDFDRKMLAESRAISAGGGAPSGPSGDAVGSGGAKTGSTPLTALFRRGGDIEKGGADYVEPVERRGGKVARNMFTFNSVGGNGNSVDPRKTHAPPDGSPEMRDGKVARNMFTHAFAGRKKKGRGASLMRGNTSLLFKDPDVVNDVASRSSMNSSRDMLHDPRTVSSAVSGRSSKSLSVAQRRHADNAIALQGEVDARMARRRAADADRLQRARVHGRR
jgi:hypothetical protein